MSGAGRRFSTWNRAFSSQPSRRGSPNGRVGDPPTGIRGRAARSTCSPALRPVSEAAGGGGVPQDPSEGNPVTGSHPTPRPRCVAGAPLAGSSPDREPMRALRRSGSRLHGGPGALLVAEGVAALVPSSQWLIVVRQPPPMADAEQTAVAAARTTLLVSGQGEALLVFWADACRLT